MEGRNGKKKAERLKERREQGRALITTKRRDVVPARQFQRLTFKTPCFEENKK